MPSLWRLIADDVARRDLLSLHGTHFRKFRKTFLLAVDAHHSSIAGDCCGDVGACSVPFPDAS
jgi:hypothetical protein